MNETIHDKLIQHYLNIVAAHPRKSVMLLKVLHVLVDGSGPRFDELEKVLAKVDEIGMMRAGEFRLNYDNGGRDDPLAQAIARVSK